MELASGQLADLIIVMEHDSIVLQEASASEPCPAGRVIADPELGQAEIRKRLISRVTPEPIADLSTAQVVDAHMQGCAMGNLTQANFKDDKLPLSTLARENQKL